ncbi:MAG TPA: HAD family phosphatase [Casimicrobiaceae bacterium]|jgi:HAD superfamily hydrolase (TIGR01509 family)
MSAPVASPATAAVLRARPRAVVFDMDGTLLDTEGLAARAWPLAASAIGVEFDAALVPAMIGRNTRDCMTLIVERHGAAFPVDDFVEAMRAAFDDLILREGIGVMPGAQSLLEWLAGRGIPAAVATSTRRVRAEAKLADAGLLPHFRGVTGGDEVHRGKPAPDIYLLAASRLGVDAPHCLAIEDSEPGFLAAHHAGMPVVFVPDQAPPSPALLAYAPRIVATLDGVREWLEGLPPATQAASRAHGA